MNEKITRESGDFYSLHNYAAGVSMISGAGAVSEETTSSVGVLPILVKERYKAV
jgi:hypothetical protein